MEKFNPRDFKIYGSLPDEEKEKYKRVYNDKGVEDGFVKRKAVSVDAAMPVAEILINIISKGLADNYESALEFFEKNKHNSIELISDLKVEEIKKITKEYPELKQFKLSANFPINENRKRGLEMIKNGKINLDINYIEDLLSSDDFIENEWAFNIIQMNNITTEQKESLIPLIKKLYYRYDERIDYVDYQGTDLIDLLGIEFKIVNLMIVLGDNNFALEIAENILGRAKNIDSSIRNHVVGRILAKLDGLSTPLLEKIATDQDENIYVRNSASEYLNGKNKKLDKENQVYNIMGNISNADRLLTNKKSLFATAHTKELAQRLSKIFKVTKEASDKFQDQYIGLLILGSTAKGYFNPKSDLEYVSVVKDRKVGAKLFYMFKRYGINGDLCRVIVVNEENFPIDELVQLGSEKRVDYSRKKVQYLFQGIFLGDMNKFKEIQKNMLSQINDSDWDLARVSIRDWAIPSENMKYRHDLNDADYNAIVMYNTLLKVPPAFNEAVSFVNKRKSK